MAQETVLIKVEVEWDNEASKDNTSGLYAKHEIKNEVMIGPEIMQPRDAAYPAHVPVSSSQAIEIHVKPEMDQVVVKSEPQEVTIKIEPEDLEQHLIEQPVWTPDVGKEEPAPGHVELVNIEDIKQGVKKLETAIQFGAETKITSQSNSCTEDKQKPKNKKDVKCSKAENYVCNICKKTFKVKSYLMMHIQFHQQFPHTCKKCEKHFMCESTLSTHDCGAEEKQPSCNICETHTGVKPHRCDACGETFLRKHHLNVHKRIHTGEKPFNCDMCKKNFSTKSRLTAHARAHTGDNPFSCKTCDARFAAKYHLAVHERLHTGEKPYSCDVCRKRFTYKHVLKSHERLHAGDTTYHCKSCDERFTSKSTLNDHERTQHVKEQAPNSRPFEMHLDREIV